MISKMKAVNLNGTQTLFNMDTVNTPEQFWKLANETRLKTGYQADEKLKFLTTASFDALKQICRQYRYFTGDYPNNLAILISKLPQGNFKSILGEILNEELGEGNTSKSHLKLYDRFLFSLGMTEDELEASIPIENQKILEQTQQLIAKNSASYGIGMVGMGAECLCQIYLSVMYEFMIKNPCFQERKQSLDLEFWDFHAGEADIEHRQKVQQLINETIGEDPSCLQELSAGYFQAKANWDLFWENNYKFVNYQ
ncbi:MAG: iron-containing redox enzyme family protein [Crocosphaera sp.]|nr:iron-containing redox enzyme family protein [Crocosphaera sp.]